MLVLACESPVDETTAAASGAALDTSGCSGLDFTVSRGPVEVHASRPPTQSCWNLASGGLTLSYVWLQIDDPTPQRTDVGFWMSLNGAATYAKAPPPRCSEVSGGGLGHDTSGTRTYRCVATRSFLFGDTPELLQGAYRPDGARADWDVRVAVSLDDHGTWDSLGGANYRFAL
jgi:hypothetical protein